MTVQKDLQRNGRSFPIILWCQSYCIWWIFLVKLGATGHLQSPGDSALEGRESRPDLRWVSQEGLALPKGWDML